MNDDPIVDEVRKAGEAYFAKFNFDLNAICDDLRRSTEEAANAGQKVVSFPPRTPEPRPVQSKKAG
jgi:hypothetical protein